MNDILKYKNINLFLKRKLLNNQNKKYFDKFWVRFN